MPMPGKTGRGFWVSP